MLRSYLNTAIRTLWKHRGFTAINVIGLAVSLAVPLLTIVYAPDKRLAQRSRRSDANRLDRPHRPGHDAS